MDPALIEGARRHFALFLHQVYSELHPNAPPLELAWYLKAICFKLEDACSRPGARLVISVPPRHLKSVAASVALPAWLLGHDPSRRIMVATYSQDLAREHAGNFWRIIESSWYKRIFPGVAIAADGGRALELKTTQGGGRKAVSVGGTVTGFGADVIIVDDCLKSDEARSEAARNELQSWFDGTLQTRQNSWSGCHHLHLAATARDRPARAPS